MPKPTEELARDLLYNLKSLADRIARKPPEFDPRWAKSIIEAFSLYTRTSTVNYFVAFGDFFASRDGHFLPILILRMRYGVRTGLWDLSNGHFPNFLAGVLSTYHC